MGIFNVFYSNRPGKGVEKDEPKKHAFFQFWTLVWRRFSRLILLNLMYFLILSPLLTVIYLFLNDFLGLLPLAQEAALADPSAESGWFPVLGSFLIYVYTQLMPQPMFMGMVILSAVLYGPFTCGFTYVLRNFARQEHAWKSDFWTRAKKNFSPGLKMGILEIIFWVFFLVSLSATRPENIQDEGSMRVMLTLSRYAIYGVGLLALFTRNYLYVILVTFDLKLRAVLQNSFIFSVLGLPRNVIVLLSQAAIAFLSMMTALFFQDGLIEIIFVALFAIMLSAFAGVFTTYPVIQKYLLDPLMKKEEEEEKHLIGEG